MDKEFEDRLRGFIRECICEAMWDNQCLNEIPELNESEVNKYITENYKESLNEMARINKKDFRYFPYNKFDIRIWSNDHNPPHFHVICDGWDIVVGIEDGSILRVKTVGKSSQVYSYVEKNINGWLDSKSSMMKTSTNREFAMATWEANN